MHPNARLIETFYTAFQARDAKAMAACYHPEIEFEDPVFGRLRGREATAMWEMLAARASDLAITFEVLRADETSGAACWEAKYPFSKTGRRVHNVIEATFHFRDGLIDRHVDRFDLWRWTRMALGAPGWLLGWTPLVQGKVRQEARRGLDAWLRRA